MVAHLYLASGSRKTILSSTPISATKYIRGQPELYELYETLSQDEKINTRKEKIVGDSLHRGGGGHKFSGQNLGMPM